ncbi:MAG: histidine phosphatase family protein, partial [Roseovarius sp.]|nr:histidine phosphatase family protein [Roseovarius sp.]
GETVLMIGHNPGIGWLAQTLVADPPPHPRFFDYPTGATLVAGFDVADWADAGTGRTVEFIVPRELTG